MPTSLRSPMAMFSLLLVAAASALAADPPSRDLGQAIAMSMADQCLAHSRANGWPPFSIAIVDVSGTLLLFRRQDGASAVTADAAILKARTSARAGVPSGALTAMSQDSPTRDLFILLQLTDDPGGVPLKRAGHIVAAIGVSGGTAEQDIGCAELAAATAGEP